jgi:diadenosine tetraphosphate (Ap4A) HIT family hydrolase
MMTGLTGNGEGGPSSEDSLIYEDTHMRYWHDAKGRALFVVTPKRHVHNLKELSKEEIYQLWSGSVQILTDMGCDAKEDLRDMILNAGVDRNHEHLHLKVRVTGRGFERARRKWSERRNRMVDKLKTFANQCG